MADNTTPDEGEDDLRADLEAAFKEAETAPEPEVNEPEPEPSEKSDRPRDEHGRFAKVEKAEEIKPEEPAKAETPAETQQAKPVEEQKPPEAMAPAAPSGPPPGWSVAAKAEFDKLPKAVQEAVVKREEEVNRGFQKLQDYKGLDRYMEVARNSGTTLDQALERYMAAEQLLDRNFSQGILGLCQNYGVHPQRLIAELSGMFGQNGQSPAPEAQQTAAPFQPILSELQALKQWQQSFIQQQEQQQAEAINSQLASFAANPANRYFENVRQDMAALINAGKATSLEDAYEQACWLNPEIRQLRIKDEADKKLAEQQAAVNQARKASASLPTGSPVVNRRVNSSSSLREQIEEAMRESTSQI